MGKPEHAGSVGSTGSTDSVGRGKQARSLGEAQESHTGELWTVDGERRGAHDLLLTLSSWFLLHGVAISSHGAR